MTNTAKPKTLNERIKAIITDGLTALADASPTDTIAPCDLHAFLFNADDPHIIYTHDACTMLDIAKRYFDTYPNAPQDVWDVLPLPTV